MGPRVMLAGVLGLLLSLGCCRDERSAPEREALVPAGAGAPVKGATVVPQPWPRTKISQSQACAIAAQHCGIMSPGAGPTRTIAFLTREGDRLVWVVACTFGHVEIAASTTTVYVAADTGDVLRVDRPLLNVR